MTLNNLQDLADTYDQCLREKFVESSFILQVPRLEVVKITDKLYVLRRGQFELATGPAQYIGRFITQLWIDMFQE